jgi:mxaJ protein
MNHSLLLRGGILLASLAVALSVAASSPGTLERIRASGTIRLCADPANAPLSAASPEPTGYDVEIAQEIAQALGARVEYFWFATTYARRAIRQLIEGQCDYIMGLPANVDFEEADARMALTDPYYTTGFVPLVAAGSAVRRFEDLRGQDVGVEMMTVADFLLFRRDVARHLYRRQQELFDAVASGEIDAALMWGPFAGWYARTNPQAGLRVVNASPPELTFSVAIGVRKGDEDLREAIDRSIAALRSDGRLGAVLARYAVPLLDAPERTGPWRLAPQDVPDAPSATSASPRMLLAMGGASPGAPDAPPAVRKGRSLYEQACYKCHGPGAISGGTIPDLRRFKGDDAEFLATVREGRLPKGMPGWKEFLTDDEIRSIHAFVKSVPVD